MSPVREERSWSLGRSRRGAFVLGAGVLCCAALGRLYDYEDRSGAHKYNCNCVTAQRPRCHVPPSASRSAFVAGPRRAVPARDPFFPSGLRHPPPRSLFHDLCPPHLPPPSAPALAVRGGIRLKSHENSFSNLFILNRIIARVRARGSDGFT